MFLQRVLGMAGAPNTDWPSLSERSSDESDVYALSVDGEGDEWLLNRI